MHNEVKQCFRGSNVYVGVVVTNESNMAAINVNNAEICPDVAGQSRSCSGDLFELSDSSVFRTFIIPPLRALLVAILDLSLTTTPILPFGACYVIVHKVYFLEWTVCFCAVLANGGTLSRYENRKASAYAANPTLPNLLAFVPFYIAICCFLWIYISIVCQSLTKH